MAEADVMSAVGEGVNMVLLAAAQVDKITVERTIAEQIKIHEHLGKTKIWSHRSVILPYSLRCSPSLLTACGPARMPTQCLLPSSNYTPAHQRTPVCCTRFAGIYLSGSQGLAQARAYMN